MPGMAELANTAERMVTLGDAIWFSMVQQARFLSRFCGRYGDIDAASGFFVGFEEGHIRNHSRHFAFDRPHIDIIALTDPYFYIIVILRQCARQVIIFE